MRSDFVQSQLRQLMDRAREFGAVNPALAPLLDRDSSDPDVERLLEAVAYQNLMLRRKLVTDFPELVHDLTQLVLPHYLRPVPATTVIGFASDAARSFVVPAGTEIASVPAGEDETRCLFRTAIDLDFHPLRLSSAGFCRASNKAGHIRLAFALTGIDIADWHPRSVRLFLAADHTLATDLYLLLSRHVTGITIEPSSGATVTLPPECLKATGFAESDALIPYPPHAFPGYRLLQEYFAMPEKFLFCELTGWEKWRDRGKGCEFSIRLELDSLPFEPQRITRDTFAVNAAPAVNLFAQDAVPISVTHRVDSYPLRPTENPAGTGIFSVDRVTGYSRSTGRERTYVPFDSFSHQGTSPVYQTRIVPSKTGFDIELVIPLNGAPGVSPETLSASLTCTNGKLADLLHTGDVNELRTRLPYPVSARNVTAINAGHPGPAGPDLAGRLIAHLCLNRRPLIELRHLRALLELYLFPQCQTAPHGAAAMKRLAGMETLQVVPGNRSIGGAPAGSSSYRLRVRHDHFAGPGDIYLFGCVLDRFLKGYSPLNNRTNLTVEESSRGATWHWPVSATT